jgi:hypothetical protein
VVKCGSSGAKHCPCDSIRLRRFSLATPATQRLLAHTPHCPLHSPGQPFRLSSENRETGAGRDPDGDGFTNEALAKPSRTTRRSSLHPARRGRRSPKGDREGRALPRPVFARGSASAAFLFAITNPATNSAARGDLGIGSWNLELGKGHGHSCPCHGLENPCSCFAA